MFVVGNAVLDIVSIVLAVYQPEMIRSGNKRAQVNKISREQVEVHRIRACHLLVAESARDIRRAVLLVPRRKRARSQ